MKKRVYLWQTIYNRLLSLGVDSYDIDIRYLKRWIDLYPFCFPKFMLSNSFTAEFNWTLMRWEIYKL